MAHRKREWSQEERSQWDEWPQWDDREGRSSRTGGHTPVQAVRNLHERKFGNWKQHVTGLPEEGRDEFAFSGASDSAYAISKTLPPRSG